MVRGAEGECLETRYQYDLKDRLTHQVTQGGAVTRYLYNQNDQLIKEINNKYRRNIIKFSESGKKEVYEEWPTIRTSWQYDDYDRKICEISPDGLETRFEYDEYHDLVKVWDSEKRETVSGYDKNHNLILKLI